MCRRHGIVAKSPQAWPLGGLLATSRFPFPGHFVQILEHKHPSGWDIVPDTKHKEYGLNQRRHDSRYKLNPQDIKLAPALNRYGHTHLTSLVLSRWPFGWPAWGEFDTRVDINGWKIDLSCQPSRELSHHSHEVVVHPSEPQKMTQKPRNNHARTLQGSLFCPR